MLVAQRLARRYRLGIVVIDPPRWLVVLYAANELAWGLFLPLELLAAGVDWILSK